jgi:hypothetical protein
MRFVIATLVWVLTCGLSYAHELTPTYFEMRPSFYDDVYATTMTMFNRREDVKYYQIEVYDEEWNPITFATTERILTLKYLERKGFEIYIKANDVDRVTYICTRSKILKGGESSVIASNICSKIK